MIHGKGEEVSEGGLKEGEGGATRDLHSPFIFSS